MSPATRRRGAPAALGVLLVFALLSPGCASFIDTEPRRTEDGLTHVRTRLPGSVAFNESLHMDGYDHLLIDRIGIDYAPGQKSLPRQDEERIFDMLEKTMVAQIDTRDQLVTEPGPCTLKVSLYVVDLELRDVSLRGSATSFVNSYGAATFVTELRDSTSDEPVLRWGQRRDLGGGTGAMGVRPDLALLEEALYDAMIEAGQMVVEATATPDVQSQVDSRAHLGCEGRLGRLRVATNSH